MDSNLGEEIEMLKPLGIKIAVISNASLIWDETVRDELSQSGLGVGQGGFSGREELATDRPTPSEAPA